MHGQFRRISRCVVIGLRPAVVDTARITQDQHQIITTGPARSIGHGLDHCADIRGHLRRALIAGDPDLSTPRGEAVRVLLWLLEQDKAIEMISVG